MAEIGVISARITADDRDFQRAFKRSRGSIRDLTDRFRRAAATAAKFTAAIGAVAAAVGTRLVSAQIKAVDQLSKTSQLLGIQTDRLAGLQFAAEQTGVSTQNLNMGLQRMVRRIAEAAQGSGEAQDAIEDLGLSAQRLANMSPDEQFRQIAAAMEQVEGQSQKVRIAFKLFDSEGAALLNTLAAGEEGLDRFQKTANELGLAVSSIESNQVVAAADAINSMQAAITGAVRTATVELSPIITEVANSFVDAARQAGGFRDQVLSGMEGAAVAIAHVQRTVKAMQIVWEGLKMSFEGVRLAIITGLKNIAEMFERFIGGQIDRTNSLIEALNRIPGVAIPAINRALAQTDLGDTFRNQARIATDNIDAIQQKMHELAMEGMDPQVVRDYFEALREESRKAAESAGGVSVTPTRAGGGGGEGGANEEERKAMEDRLEMIREHLMTEQEIRNKRHETRLEQLRTFREQELLTKKEFDQLERDLEAKHQDELLKQRQRGMQASTALMDTQFGAQTGMMLKEFRTQLTAMSEHNKKAFQVQKAFAISDAIVSAYQGISKTLAAYPYPFNLGLAAAHAAVAFAKVNAIRSQSFGGGGAGSTALPGSSAAQQPAQQGPGSDAQGGGGPTREATFNIQGDNFGPDAIEQIATGLNEFMGDNGDLKVNVRRAS